ncbi:MAG: hypothetical protein ACRD4S_03505 [Candidatus Acidiferrales bacterium]
MAARAIFAGQVSALIFAASFALAVEVKPVPQLSLRVTKTVPLPLNADPVSSTKCDASGNIYLRFYQMPNFLAAPIVKVSPEGKQLATFSIRSISGFERADLGAFTVGLRGEIVGLVVRPDPQGDKAESGLITFKDDGSFDSYTALESSFSPFNLAVFSSGEYLISGIQRMAGDSNPIHPSGMRPFTAIFDQSARLIKRFTLTGDVKQPKPDEAGGISQNGRVPREISTGAALTGSDGNIYLVRMARQPIVFVIAGNGTILRRMELNPPSDKYSASNVRYSSAGKLAVLFGEPTKADPRVSNIDLISVYDAETGDRLVDYQLPPEAGAALLCYTPNAFTFLGSTDQGQLTINEANPY